MKGGGNYKETSSDAFPASVAKQHQWAKASPAKWISPSFRFFSSRSLVCIVFFTCLCIFYILTFSAFPFSSCSNSQISISDSDHPGHLIRLSSSNSSFIPSPLPASHPPPVTFSPPPPSVETSTGLNHIVFGIAASANFWQKRKEYIKIWWRPRQMRGYVWLDSPVNEPKSSAASLPAIKISADSSKFPYSHKQGSRSALRISRIVSETVRLGLDNVRWFVMGDDDTVFFPDNLVRVLNKFDYRQPYYIGSYSESHLQNIIFSYSMAYGGGGFAISRPLAVALSRMQDRCIHRYPALYGSDDRIQACMAELGVPLTRHSGFHQFDVYGDLLGLLAAHPVAPLVSLHHLDLVEAIFPNSESHPAAVRQLFEGPVRLDSAGVMQQSICYVSHRHWTVSVSWGFVVQVVRGIISPREMETPARTFLNWYRRADYTAYAFNTRPVARNPCQKPFLYYLSSASYDNSRHTTVTRYLLYKDPRPPVCRWKIANPSTLVDEVVVYKKPDPLLWDRAPRRNCCRVLPSSKAGKRMMAIEVGLCRDGELAGTN
ncbi:uncharacterized protein LOC110039586 [Phalaenopsis equestris]|uniref:uncharacterized protein LOC110039586 n=1 Tax=Phalaenopsis equestris TaxID=78828 RepID=UPI0009E2A4B3|nr:uncharacterized protein LOC110039586 [Phalaenopsis equestris]XP_020600368.1 uncharacterized protein LOC110039586 [Phalaenopsis equestris]